MIKLEKKIKKELKKRKQQRDGEMRLLSENQLHGYVRALEWVLKQMEEEHG